MESYKGHIPFDKVCKDRTLLLPELSEGDTILNDIINYCISLHSDPTTHHKIETYECCGGHQAYDIEDYEYFEEPGSEYKTYVMFEIDINEEEYIYSILNRTNLLNNTRYKIAQNNREDNGTRSFLLDVSLSYRDRESANQFLMTVKEGLIDYKKYGKLNRPEIKSIITLLKNVYNPNQNLVVEKNKYNEYIIMSKSSYCGSPLNLPSQKKQNLTLKEVIELQPEIFEQKFFSQNHGIQRTKQIR